MSKKHDFKQAISEMEEEMQIAVGAGFPMHDDPTIQAHYFALRLADRLQSGEVSRNMIKSTQSGWHYEDVYRAMTTQLMKEVENE